MNQESIELLLEHSGFHKLGTNLEEVTVAYKREPEELYLLILCSFTGQRRPDVAGLLHIIQTISMDGRFYAEKKHVLALLVTSDTGYGRALIQAGIPAWIIDADSGRLMIYENQPSDFAGIRSGLEGLSAALIKPEKRSRGRGGKSPVTPVNTVLVAVNIVIFLLMGFAGDAGSSGQMIKWGAMYTPLMGQPEEFYRVVTSMFLHFDIAHLTGNMVILIALGDNLERAMGGLRYLILYLLSGVGAGMASSIYNSLLGEVVVAAGASGAIFGVIGALFWLVMRNRGRLEELTAPRLGLMILYILYSGFTTPGVDNAAHVGGLLTGLILACLLKRGGYMRGNS